MEVKVICIVGDTDSDKFVIDEVTRGTVLDCFLLSVFEKITDIAFGMIVRGIAALSYQLKMAYNKAKGLLTKTNGGFVYNIRGCSTKIHLL